jgi:hypothetical protein
VWLALQQPVDDPAPPTARPPAPPPAAAVPVATPAPAPAPARPAIALTGLAPSGSWIEVRRGGEAGERLFQGVLAPGVTRRWSPTPPLWVRVGNTDALTASVGGRRRALPGGTGNFRVSTAGVARLSD